MANDDLIKPKAKRRYKRRKVAVGRSAGRLPVQPRYCYHCGMPQPKEVVL